MTLTVPDVTSWPQDDDQATYPPDDQHVALVVAAVNDFVDHLPSIRTVDDGTGTMIWAPSTRLGAIMLAARLVRRRNSPAGIEGFTANGATYVTRHDPDVAQQLRLGRHAAPKTG